MSNSFFSIPREKLLKLYPEIVKNSDEHYQVAIEIANSGRPGIAISHLLISTEELIKTLIIMLDAKGLKFRTVKGIDIFFRNHEIRFFMGSLIFAVTLFGDDAINLLGKIKKDHNHVLNFLKAFKNNDQATLSKLNRYLLRKYIIIQNEIKWFSQAEIFRQNGFYVDMKGNLVSPQNIDNTQFQDTKKRIDKVNKAIKYIIGAFESNDETMKIEVERLIKTFDNEKFYDLISKELENMRNGRKSFFETLLSKYFDDLSDRNKRKKNKAFYDLMERTRNNPSLIFENDMNKKFRPLRFFKNILKTPKKWFQKWISNKKKLQKTN